MFGRTADKRSTVVDQLVRPPGVRPVPAAIPDGYQDQCERLGVKLTVFTDNKLMQWMLDNEVPLYDYDQVMGYLRRQADRRRVETGHTQEVRWVPLRDCDGTHTWNSISTHPYDKMVPARVLSTIEKIDVVFPGARFFISDIRDYPDPFAAVDIGTGKLHVFAVWDEPGFSG